MADGKKICARCGELSDDCQGIYTWNGEFYVVEKYLCHNCARGYDECHFCGNLFSDDLSTVDGKKLCKECEYEYGIKCTSCRKPLNKNSCNTTVDDDYLCELCRTRYHYLECHRCNRFGTENDMESDDHRSFCKTCFKKSYLRCDYCDKIFRNDEGVHDEETGEYICESCLDLFDVCTVCGNWSDADFLKTNDFVCSDCYKIYRTMLDLIPDEQIDKIYHDIGKRIYELFMTSIARRESKRKLDKREMWIENWFPYLKFDFINLTFTDENNRKKPLSFLSSPKHDYFKSMADEKKDDLSRNVSMLYNKKRDSDRTIKTETDHAIRKIRLAIRFRMAEEKDRPDVKKMTDSVVGNYPYQNPLKSRQLPNNAIFIRISKDPIDLLAKSTGQTWEELSCEKFGGVFGEGIFSDIINQNLVAFLTDGKINYARIMIRWCENKKDKRLGLGIESKWYYGDDRSVESDSWMPLASEKKYGFEIEAQNATVALEDILKKAGYYDYLKCITPYRHAGYSDTMHEGRVRIHYKR